MKRNTTFIKNILLAACLFFFTYLTAQNNLIPDNCSSATPPFAFDIQPKWSTSTENKVYTCTTPLVGDIDGDGKTEVFALTSDNSIYLFEGATGTRIGSINPGVTIANGGWTGTSFCLLDGNKNGKGEVFIAAQSGNIYLYEVSSAPSTRPITFTQKWVMPGFAGCTSPVVADLNGDGSPEFVAGNKIFDYNGNLKATLAYNGTAINFGYVCLPLVVDLDANGLPEVVVGTNVYKYNGSTAVLWKSCPNIPNQEGCNMAADINQDGHVDLVFHTYYSTHPGFIKVWTPATNEDLGVVVTNLSGQRSIPFVGDIDGVSTGGKKYPEICFNTASRLYAFSYTGSTFVEKWSMSHTDGSGGTILTLFDFNNDGVTELIYRDETLLQIFDGSGSAPVSKYSTPAGSETASELPIVVDLTGTGSANILVTGSATPRSGYGEVMVFEGASSKWAAAPNVWNQQLYSNLLVNTDLTIPQTVSSPNVKFTQTCANKNGNQVQFYNGGPMQAPLVSEVTYCPIDYASDPFIVNGDISISGNSVTISVTFGNQGGAVLPSNVPIQFYGNSIAPGNIIGNATLGVNLALGQTHTITRTFTASPMPASFYVRIMDDGTNFPALGAFSDCDLTNNIKSFGTLEVTKEVNQLSACLNSASIFTIKIKNDGATTYSNIQLTDSLGFGWDFISATPSSGTTTGTYNPATRMLNWTVPSLAQGETATLTMQARSTISGDLRNFVWIKSVNGLSVEKEYRSAYVLVSNNPAPVLNSIADNTLCAGSMQSAITFSGSDVVAANCTWTNNHPEIGLAAAGAGNIPAFATINSTGSSITATIKVTPVSSDGCIGVPQTFTIEVTPAIVPAITIQATPN